MNETVKFWLEELPKSYGKNNLEEITTDELRTEIDDVKGTISNEHLFELGYNGNEPCNPHTQNIEELKEYLEILEERLGELNN